MLSDQESVFRILVRPDGMLSPWGKKNKLSSTFPVLLGYKTIKPFLTLGSR